MLNRKAMPRPLRITRTHALAHFAALGFAGCATTPPAQRPTANSIEPAQEPPRLEKTELQVGLSENVLIPFIAAQLPDLATCVAHTLKHQDAVSKLEAPERLDDRVKVTLRRNQRFAAPERSPLERLDPFRLEVEAVLSDPDCVARRIRRWPWPSDQLALAALEPAGEQAVLFIYRYRPSDETRARLARENQEAFDAFCPTDEGRGPLVDRFARMRGQRKDQFSEGLASSLDAISMMAPTDRDPALAGAAREVATSLGLKPTCPALLRYVSPDLADLLALPGRPTLGCAGRVEAMKKLAASGIGLEVSPELVTPRSRPIVEPGAFIDIDAPLPSAAEVRERARHEAAKQQRTRPIAYLLADAGAQASALLHQAALWQKGFELRLVTWHPVAQRQPTFASTAWPEAVAFLSRSFDSTTFTSLAGTVGREESDVCPGLSDSTNAFVGPAERRLERWTEAVADGLARCGCPNDYAEITWARLALTLDQLAGHAGWVPFELTDSPKSPAVTLRHGTLVFELLEHLSDSPVRFTLKF